MEIKSKVAVSLSFVLGVSICPGEPRAGTPDRTEPSSLMEQGFLDKQILQYNERESKRKDERKSLSPWRKAQVEKLLQESGVFRTIDLLKPIDWTSQGIPDHAIEKLLSFTTEPISSIVPEKEFKSLRTASFEGGLSNDKSTFWISNSKKLFTDFEAIDDPMTSKDARGRAHESFKSLGIRLPGELKLDVLPLTSTPMEKKPSGEVVVGQKKIVAQKAFFSFDIQGVRLNGAKATFGFFSDGTLQKASLQWPVVQSSLRTHTSVRHDRITDLVYRALVQHPLGAKGLEHGLVATLELVVKDRELVRVVSITGQVFGPDGKPGRFSSFSVEIE